MTKTLLIGPAGFGKTHAVLDSFEKSLRDGDPLTASSFFVVPSAEHTERVVSMLIQRGLPGFFHKRVTTLSRLVDSVFQIPEIPVASGMTRTLLVRELVSENDWEYFREVKDRPGFVNLALGLITELKESLITPEAFRERMNSLKNFEPAFGAKYEALAAIYEGYEVKLKERGMRDSQDTIRIFRERSEKKSGEVRFRDLWLDGFFDFSNLQFEYLRELSSMTERMTVTLTVEEGEAFEMVQSTRRALEGIGFTVVKTGTRNFRTKNPALIHLRENLFREPRGNSTRSVCSSRGVIFLESVGVEGEIELIAREIHKIYSRGNCRYSDFAVLFRQVRHYGPMIASVFSRYGIPVEIHERERLKFSPWIGAVISLLLIFRNGWRRDDVLAFLKSGYVTRIGEMPKTEEWLSRFEAGVFMNGVLEGREMWEKDWAGEESLVVNSESGKKKVLETLIQLESDFLKAQSVEEHIRILKQAVTRTFGMIETSDAYTPMVRRDAVSVNRFETLLEEIRLNETRGRGRPVSFEFFADQFLGLVELDVYSLHERDKNRVQIYDVSLARQKEYKTVFVAGLLERVFPIQIRENALLSDWERRMINAGLEHPLQELLPRQSLERYLFYLAVTRASERLYLSCPRVNLEGKESLKSFFLEDARGIFGSGDSVQVIRQDLSRPYPSVEESITGREREIAVMGVAREMSEKKRGKGKLDGAAPVSLEKLLDALRPVKASLEDEAIRAGGYFEIREVSPTRLEEFARCPYRYFAHQILKLQDPMEDMTARQKGNIMHWVLEAYFREWIRQNGKRPLPAEFVETKLAEAFEKYPLSSERKYREELDRAEVREMLFSVIEKEAETLLSRKFQPAYVEFGFGPGKERDAPAFVIVPGKKGIAIRGRIDRIDIDPERKAALVVDYKRTAKLDRSALELGTSLQLPLYILVAEKLLGLTLVGGELFALKEGKRSGFYQKDECEKYGLQVSKLSGMSGEEFRRVLDRSVDFVKRFTEEIRGLNILVRPRDCEKYCPYAALCRIEKWRIPVILQEIREADARAVGQGN
ncbi:MAG: ATP-dependent helicase/deoxyribonuclease subunit B [Candidatus Omnitrophica bacterium ADurb.Bin292]|nr:MAG: ATP-dependent helicase/deoxyribonuclease subunit B [Candidatus Omnitrophica bacterium ADurb.Bin292]